MSDYRLQQLDILIDLHNNTRTNRWFWKKQPLIKNKLLMSLAQKWANKMAIQDKLFYNSSPIIEFPEIAQNIAYEHNSPEKVMKSWMKNFQDKLNINNESFTDIGCGMSLSQNGKLYWCVYLAKK